ADKCEKRIEEIAEQKRETPLTMPKELKALGRKEYFERPLRVGSVGSDVGKMKEALIEKGYLEMNAAGGDLFGISTRRAVERLQEDFGLRKTGRVDAETWEYIFK
ncbi:MAG: peptidoglycan-binding protein, partial [Clostridia bacterium]|nr:peptidoglycan-binding protein [Clostridia bacterium]